MLERIKRLPIQIANKKLSNAECKFDILFSPERVSSIFFLIIEAKPLHSLDTGNKCEMIKISFKTSYFN